MGIQSKAPERLIEADLEEVQTLFVGLLVGRQHGDEALRRPVPDLFAGQRTGLTVDRLGPRKRAQHAVVEDLVEPLEPGVGIVGARRSHEVQ